MTAKATKVRAVHATWPENSRGNARLEQGQGVGARARWPHVEGRWDDGGEPVSV